MAIGHQRTVSFLRRHKNYCSESLNTLTEATSCGRLQGCHSHQPDHMRPARRSSTKTTLLPHPTSSPPDKTNPSIRNLTGSALPHDVSAAEAYSHSEGGFCKGESQTLAPRSQALPAAPVWVSTSQIVQRPSVAGHTQSWRLAQS